MWPARSVERAAPPGAEPLTSPADPPVNSFAEPVRSLPEDTARPPAVLSPAIHAMGLTKQYGHTMAVKGLEMTVGRGEVFGFLGPNGAGKTTVVKMLLGLVAPSAGEAMVLGSPIGDREARRRIGYLPELFRFQALLTAREVLRLHCRLLALPKPSWREEIESVLATVGLSDRGDDRIGAFSKGMQQRLGLAVSLLGDPLLVVLDEPTSALDPVGRHDVREIVRGLRARGTTVFLNTHLLEEAEHVCDRVAVIDKGRVIATGSLDELLTSQSRVRVRVRGLLPEGWGTALSGFGDLEADGQWLTVVGIDPVRVPVLVSEIIRLGGLIEAVVPEHQSLESRFLELLGEQEAPK